MTEECRKFYRSISFAFLHLIYDVSKDVGRFVKIHSNLEVEFSCVKMLLASIHRIVLILREKLAT